jgi:CubicO group peptidase (beta-lactamase class C family)
MSWFNLYGLIFVVALILPNIVATIKKKTFENSYKNRVALILENVSRCACIIFMVFNIPYTWIGFWFTYGKIVYIAVCAALIVAYWVCWLVFWNKRGIVKALLLSAIPSLIFLISAILIGSIPLFVFGVIFTACHILISVKNAAAPHTSGKIKRQVALTISALLLSVIIICVSTFGGALLVRQSEIDSFVNMSAEQLINYDCKQKGAKISIAVIENSNITYHTYGNSGEETSNESLAYDYEIGSISKTFVGLLCAKAVNEGKIKLTDSIADYIDLGTTTSTGSAKGTNGDSDDNGMGASKYYPTIERLLTHTSGYAPYYFESNMIGNKLTQISNDFYGISSAQILNKVKTIDLEDKDYPFTYSNFGISVIGLVLEKVYGQNFTDLMNNFIAEDLHLTSTKVAAQSGNLSGYWRWSSCDGYIPAGAIISNIYDIAAYLNVYLTNSITYAQTTALKLKDVSAGSATYDKLNIRVDSVGMTWMLDAKNGIVWHNGATTNFNSYIGFSNDFTRGVVVLSNLNSEIKASATIIGTKLLLG